MVTQISFLSIGLLIGITFTLLLIKLAFKSNSVKLSDYNLIKEEVNNKKIELSVEKEKVSTLTESVRSSDQEISFKTKEVNLITGQFISKSTELEGVKNNFDELKKQLIDEKAINIEFTGKFNTLNTNYAIADAELNSLKTRLEEMDKQLNAERNLVKNLNSINENLNKNISTEKANLQALKDNYEIKSSDLAQLKIDIKNKTEEFNEINKTNAQLTAQNESLLEKLETQKNEIEELRERFNKDFENIAAKILEEKSGKFTETNKINIEALLKPLGENIDNFKKKVEETYDKESKERFTLESKVKDLIEQTNKVSNEANNLATALKGQSKKQGNWGEMILESILQKSGLVKDREYFLQQTLKDEEGKNLRPDVLIKLPDNRIIIIDSKVSLVSYDKFSSADSLEEQTIYLTEHLKSIYGHIKDLSEKKYDNHKDSLDFTMMFIPIEPAYIISIQTDQDLWSEAYSKRILLISPTNLIACLKIISDLWKREMQSKNAIEIINTGEKLYEKFVNFAVDLENVGKHINKTQSTYLDAINKFKEGRGNLVSKALKLKELGLKSSMVVPESMMPNDLNIEEIIEPKLLENNDN